MMIFLLLMPSLYGVDAAFAHILRVPFISPRRYMPLLLSACFRVSFLRLSFFFAMHIFCHDAPCHYFRRYMMLLLLLPHADMIFSDSAAMTPP